MTQGLLGPDDPPPISVENEDGTAPLLILCDHASNRLPARLGTLGLEPAALAQHIAWDIGAAETARRLAAALDAPLILSVYSRLAVDCNRSLHDPTLIPEVSDGIAVPGNHALPAAERRQRIEALHRPYHETIDRHLGRLAAHRIAPAVISIHSFTPRMAGFDRPWHVGVLWDKDPRIPLPLIERLALMGGLAIGDNLPYSARSPQGFTMTRHAVAHGLSHVLVELRQDEVADPAGAARYAGFLERALRPILDDPDLYRPAFYP